MTVGIFKRSAYSPNADINATLVASTDVVKRLKGLNEKMQKTEARKAARKAMQVVRKAAVTNAQGIDDPDTKDQRIWKNISVQYSPRQSKRVGGVVMRVGVKGGARQYSTTKENVRRGLAKLYDKSQNKWYKTLGDAGNPGGDTWYWRFLEFGTSKMGARPVLQQALAENTQQVTDVVVGEIKLSLDKMVPPR